MASSIGVGMAQSMVLVFTRENYDTWKIKIQTLLLLQEIWDVVDKGLTELTAGHQSTAEETKQLAENQMRDARALFLI